MKAAKKEESPSTPVEKDISGKLSDSAPQLVASTAVAGLWLLLVSGTCCPQQVGWPRTPLPQTWKVPGDQFYEMGRLGFSKFFQLEDWFASFICSPQGANQFSSVAQLV